MVKKKDSHYQIEFNFDDAVIFLILFFNFLISFFSIFYARPGQRPIWGPYIVYSRLVLLIIDLIYISYKTVILLAGGKKITVPLFIVNIFCYLLYIFIPSTLFYSPSKLSFFTNAFTYPLTFVAYYIYAEEYDFTSFFRLSIVVLILLDSIAMIGTLHSDGITNAGAGCVYHFITALPMILFLVKGKAKWFLVATVFLLTFAATKRTGTVTIIIGLALYWLLEAYVKDFNMKEVFRNLLFLFAFLIVIYLIISYTSISKDIFARFGTIFEDRGSGRIDIWENIINKYNNSPLLQKIIGHGYHALATELQLSGHAIYAHNSYLQTLYDLGVIGMVWLVLIVISLICSLIVKIMKKNEYAPAGAMAICIIIAFSLVSYFFEESGTIVILASFWGGFEGISRKKILQLKESSPVKYRYLR